MLSNFPVEILEYVLLYLDTESSYEIQFVSKDIYNKYKYIKNNIVKNDGDYIINNINIGLNKSYNKRLFLTYYKQKSTKINIIKQKDNIKLYFYSKNLYLQLLNLLNLYFKNQIEFKVFENNKMYKIDF